MRIACVICDMGPGGAQRVLVQLCNHLAGCGHAVKLVTLTVAEAPFFELSKGVELLPIGIGPDGSRFKWTLRVAVRIGALRRMIAGLKPDLVISFIDSTNTMVLLATVGLAVPVIVSERVDPAAYAHRLSWKLKSLRSLTYRRARRIVVQTRRAAKFFAATPAAKLATIANPVPAAPCRAQPAAPGPDGRWRIIGVGRLDHQKGFDLLIDAFASLADRFPAWDVVIFGNGPERPALQARIESCGLSHRFSLRPATADIAGELARSHVMAFPSRFEGFPNALAEAMAAGLPVIAFENVSGVEDLVAPGVTGVLAAWGDGTDAAATRALSGALESLLASAELRARLGAAASASLHAFAPPAIFAQWDALIAAVMRERA